MLSLPRNFEMRSQKRGSRIHPQPARSSRSLDPDDLSARLAAVIAEREAAEAKENNDRSQSVAVGRVGRRTDPKARDFARSSHIETAPTRSASQPSSRTRRPTSFHGPTGLEYSNAHRVSRAGGASFLEPDERLECPLLPSAASAAFFAPTVSYGHRARAGATTRRTSHAPELAKPSSDSRHVQFAEPGDSASRRRVSASAVRHLESPAGHAARRSSPKASQGSWEGMHEPTIFEAVPMDFVPAERQSMFERTPDQMGHDSTQPRRMTAGDVPKTQGVSDDAVASPSSGGGSDDMAHYEAVYDEDAKVPRSKKSLFHRADSIFKLRRGSNARSARSGEDSSNSSLADSTEGNYAVAGGESVKSPLKSPQSPKSPTFLRGRSFWPFKKQGSTVETH